MTSIIFFGSDRYSALVLTSLINDATHPITLVITTPPKPVGRDAVLTPNPVENTAKEHNIKVSYYPSNQQDLDTFIASLPITPNTVGLTASFPRILPSSLITRFSGRLYNIHPSLLPQYRNVAPGPYAIAMGDTLTGITIFRIGEGIDNGEIVAQIKEPILPTDTTPILLNRLFVKGTELLVSWLTGEPAHPPTVLRTLHAEPLIFTRKLTRESGYLEWPILQKLINKEQISAKDTSNPLARLRLTHHPDRTDNILPDLVRALDGYEKVWSEAETKKGKITVAILYLIHDSQIMIHVSGKPKPITWSDFTKYYL